MFQANITSRPYKYQILSNGKYSNVPKGGVWVAPEFYVLQNYDKTWYRNTLTWEHVDNNDVKTYATFFSLAGNKKKVDYYNDGTKYGNYINGKGGALSIPAMVGPQKVLFCYGLTVRANFKWGNANGKLLADFTRDPSKASGLSGGGTVSLSTEIKASIVGSILGCEGIVGVSGSLESPLTLKGNAYVNERGVYANGQVEVGSIVAKAEGWITVGNLECKYKAVDLPLFDGFTIPFCSSGDLQLVEFDQ